MKNLNGIDKINDKEFKEWQLKQKNKKFWSRYNQRVRKFYQNDWDLYEYLRGHEEDNEEFTYKF